MKLCSEDGCASVGGSAGCGAAGEVITIVDNGDGTCTALYTQSNRTSTPSTCLTPFFATPCDAFAGSIEIYITYPDGTTPATYKQPAIQMWLTNVGVGNITVLGQLLAVFVDHSRNGTLPPLAPSFLTSLEQAGSLYVRECGNCFSTPPSGVPSASNLIALPGLVNIYQLVWQGPSTKASTAMAGMPIGTSVVTAVGATATAAVSTGTSATTALGATASAADLTGGAINAVLQARSPPNPLVRAGANFPAALQVGRPVLGTSLETVGSPAGGTALKRGSRTLLAVQDYANNLGAGRETLFVSFTAFPDMTSCKGLVCPPKYINLTYNSNLTTLNGLNQLATSLSGTILQAIGSGPFTTAGSLDAIKVLGDCYRTPSTAPVFIPIGCNQNLTTWQSICTYQGSPAW